MSLSSNMLSGKVALVTGGSRGIGAGIVKRLAREGAAIAFTYAASHAKAQQLAQSIEAEGGRVLVIHADSADAAAVQSAIDQTVETLGRLDVFVNNAGILLGGTIDQVSLHDLDEMLAVNVRSVYVGIQAAARHMAEGGRIVTIGSVVAQRRGWRRSTRNEGVQGSAGPAHTARTGGPRPSVGGVADQAYCAPVAHQFEDGRTSPGRRYSKDASAQHFAPHANGVRCEKSQRRRADDAIASHRFRRRFATRLRAQSLCWGSI